MFLRSGLVVAVFLTACGDPPASIEFVDLVPAHPRVGELVTVKFKLVDYRGVAQAGTTVKFTVEGGDRPGILVMPKTATSLKGSGEASTQVLAGVSTGGLIIKAEAGGRVAFSPNITFAGTGSSGTQFTFQCGPFAGEASGGIHAIGAYSVGRDMIAGVKLKCTAHVGDRNGDGVPGALVSFLTEAGTIGPTETSMTDVIGNATILYKTSYPLPIDTKPGVFQWNPVQNCVRDDGTAIDTDKDCTGEYLVPLWMEPNTWTTNPLATLLIGTPVYDRNNLKEPRRTDPVIKWPDPARVNNPRDNLVTLLAWTPGEEGYLDVNQNGIHDADEPIEDLTEPFVDSNDNGTYDPQTERYVDSNGNGKWDGKNGTWDAHTNVWREERILWTGIPYARTYLSQADDYGAPEPTVDAARPLGSSKIECFGGVNFEIAIADPWFNSMARNGGGDGCKKQSTTPNVDVPDLGGATGYAFTYPPVGQLQFSVVDALDRMPMPMTTPPQPGCFPAAPVQGWGVTVACEFTASPEDGYKTHIPFGASGTITNNLP